MELLVLSFVQTTLHPKDLPYYIAGFQTLTTFLVIMKEITYQGVFCFVLCTPTR